MENGDRRVKITATTREPENLDDRFIREIPCCVCERLPDRGTFASNHFSTIVPDGSTTPDNAVTAKNSVVTADGMFYPREKNQN